MRKTCRSLRLSRDLNNGLTAHMAITIFAQHSEEL